MTWTSLLPDDNSLVTMSLRNNIATRRSTMNIKRIGIDLAKNSFSICAVDENDKIVRERTLTVELSGERRLARLLLRKRRDRQVRPME